MKSEIRRLDSVLRDLARLKVVALHGADGNGIREAARQVVAAAAGSADDPFRVSECDGDSRESVEAAMDAPGLDGGRPVVWARHAGERLLDLVRRALAAPVGPLLVLELGSVTSRSQLRAAIEQNENGCAIACGVHPAATREAVRTALDACAVEAPDEVVRALAAQADALACPGFMAGLAAALYAGPGGRLELGDLVQFSDGPALGGLDAGLTAGLAGNMARLDRALADALDGGASGVTMLRHALLHLQRLRALSIGVAQTGSLPSAIRSARYPPFFGHEQALGAALRLWTTERLGHAARALWEAERSVKAAGVPDQSPSREAVAALSRDAVSRVGRGR